METQQEKLRDSTLVCPHAPPSSHAPPSKVERFLKLGYAHRDIHRVLRSLRPDAQTNDILEELIKTSPRPAHPSSSTPRLVTAPRGCSLPDPNLRTAPRGCSLPDPNLRTAPADHSNCFRPVVIDGSNVAMSHGNQTVFSCRGLQLAVMWFWGRGLRDITVFVPLWRKEKPRPDTPITDQHILEQLERRRILVYTPSRCVGGKRMACYDDCYIVRLAVDSDGSKRTYGAKCKFYHPERANQSQLSVADELRAMSRPTPSHLEVELNSMYPPPSPPLRGDHTHPRAGPAQGPPASLESGSLEGSVSGLCLQSDRALSSGYASNRSGYSSFRSEPCGGGVWRSRPLAPPPRWSSMPGGGATEEERRRMSSQLSTLFPPRTVREIMSSQAHSADPNPAHLPHPEDH
ncbi:hypothetical protein CRUP_036990 [Coryphaenoides rupestris]|nr:hypothetical protein CRUP_036990 [Coryphaenoides rupestris]